MRFVIQTLAARLGIPARLFEPKDSTIMDSLLSGAIEVIREMAKGEIECAQEHANTITPISGVTLRNGRKKFMHKGEIIDLADDAPALKVVFADLDSLAAFIDGKEDGEGELQPTFPDASVWHKDDNVTAILNDAPKSFRDDRATWPLRKSKKFAVLVSEAAKPKSHKLFIAFLVTNLRDEFEKGAPGLLGKLRNLKMMTATAQEGNIQHGRESMGKSLEAEVIGAADLPETVIIPVARWADLDHVAEVECLLELDPVQGTLALTPLADQLERAENLAQAWLHGRLTDELSCPVYYGTP
jgi:hypothetical protein